MCFVKKACTMWIKVEECSLPDMNKVLIYHGKMKKYSVQRLDNECSCRRDSLSWRSRNVL